MQPLVFISYLRATGAGWAQAVFGELEQHFDTREIFFDRDANDVPLGTDFWIPITDALQSCQVVLAIIDERWADTISALTRKRRSVLPSMCQELVTAFEYHRVVIPLLIDSNRLPSMDRLPKQIAPLVRYPILEIYPAQWKPALDRLISQIGEIVRRNAKLEFELNRNAKLEFESQGFDSFFTGDVIAAERLARKEIEMLALMDPKDRARYLLQKKMKEMSEDSYGLERLQHLRHQSAVEVIGNIK